YDNAKAESFMKTLKQEEINGCSYHNLNQARSAIGAFIETIYNRQRLHSALDYRSPDEYEATLAVRSGCEHLEAANGKCSLGTNSREAHPWHGPLWLGARFRRQPCAPKARPY